jgi:capsule polysaccharide export protein KpsE/RkpR
MKELDTPALAVDQDDGTDTHRTIRVTEIVMRVCARWLTILLGSLTGLILSGAYATLHPKKYTASALLMPPDSQSLSTTSTLAALNGTILPAGLGSSGGLLNARTPGETVVGILGSRSVQDSLIERFHLQEEYGTPRRSDTRKHLETVSEITEDKKSGLLHIFVTDKDPRRARDLADGYVTELNRVLGALNSSTAHRERVFLEERVKSLRDEIDQIANDLSGFSSKTGTLNPTAQAQALVESATRSELERGAAQADLSALRAQYSDDNVRVKAAQARVSALTQQLTKSGAASDGSSTHGDGAGLPTLRGLPMMAITYTNLSQRLLAQQGVYALLTRQYEVARVEEAKQIPSVKLLDPAAVPDRPAGLNPLLLTLLGTFLFAVLSTTFVMAQVYWQTLSASSSLKSTLASLRTPLHRR